MIDHMTYLITSLPTAIPKLLLLATSRSALPAAAEALKKCDGDVRREGGHRRGLAGLGVTR